MASTVYTVQFITLQDEDESEAVLKPLPIKKHRRFMDEWSKIDKVEDEQAVMDVLVTCAGIGLEKQFKTQVTDKVERKNDETEKAWNKRKEEAWTEWLEESLDNPTINKILEVCGGLKLSDPNLQAAAQEMERRQRKSDGTSSV